MSSIGEVVNLGVFTTSVKELDEELMFTGRYFSLPNNIFFTSGVYNYTKENLMFWYTIHTKLRIGAGGSEDSLARYRNIVQHCHQSLMDSHPQRYENVYQHRPKYKYSLTDSGINIETRISAHFYNVLELNNTITSDLIDAHRA